MRERPGSRCLLVVHRGKIVHETYHHGDSADTCYNIKSASKGVLSALVGIALREKLIKGVDQSIAELLPEYFERIDDPRKKAITLRHLLTMRAGLAWAENGPSTHEWFFSNDLTEWTLNSRLSSEPGTSFNYSTPLTHTLAVILARTSGTDLFDFSRKHLFDPVGMNVRFWFRDMQGNYFGGSEMHMSARDMARFGFLYLNKGRWAGRQIVPENWVVESVRKQTGKDQPPYGYLWWIGECLGSPLFAASGWGGQLICVVPDKDLVVVITTDLKQPGDDGMKIVTDCIVPAVPSARRD